MSLTGTTLLPIGVRQVKGHGTGGSRGVSRTLIALALTLLCSGCVGVGTAVRVATWHQDPSPFSIIIRDEGIQEAEGWDTDGSCLVVFGDHVLRNQRIDVSRSLDGREHRTSLRCLPSPAPQENSTAYAALSTFGSDMPDLSLPKAERKGPLVMEEDRSTTMLADGLLFLLNGQRLGAAGFCPTIEVEVTSLRIVLNAGIDRDLHVIVGEGTRECSFP